MATPKSPFAASLAIHIGFALLLFTAVTVHVQQQAVSKKPATFIDIASYRRVVAQPRPLGGGGGGAKSPIPVAQGQLPKQASRPFAPPMIREFHEAVLLVQPALLNEADPTLMAVKFPQWGDPLAAPGPPSNGPGSDGGMGSGHRGGVGPSNGQRYGPGPGPGSGIPLTRTGIKAPEVLYQVDPESSEEARRAKYNGTVFLDVDVDVTGHATNIRVARSVGLGLDEKAVEAVLRWRFKPGMKDGKPILVPARIEVNFHLL